MTTTTLSPDAASAVPSDLPSAEELAALKISPEVAWYLVSRGIPLPTCPPEIRTPEPRDVPGARFDPTKVDRVLASFRRLRHTKGKWAGKPLVPDPWQVAYVLAPVFGWVRFDDEADAWVRIVRELYVDLPRKNGKSTLSGGIAVYLLGGDGEQGGEVVAAATTKDQAGFVFDPIKGLVEHAPGLKRHFKAYSKVITHPRSGSTFKVISSTAEAQHGANLNGYIVDELHVHAKPDLVETLETGTGSRSQPLGVIITTADDGRQGTIYDRKRRRVEQLAARVITDPTVYGVIWAVGKTDDPFVEATWRKANPGFGISPTKAYLEKKATGAQNSPAELSSFQRLHLGLRTNQATRYLELAAWDRNAGIVDESKLVGRVCYGGLDLAATSDLTALCLLFPDEDGGYDVIWRHWLPERAFTKLVARTAKEAEVWRREGWLTVTPGDVTDYGYIFEQLKKDRVAFRIRETAFDRWNATQIITDLRSDGMRGLVELGQGYASMSAPTKELQRLVLAGAGQGAKPRLRHGGNPLMRWQVDNLAVATDPAGNVKPDKDAAGDKIDGFAALVDALARAMLVLKRRSAYADRDQQAS